MIASPGNQYSKTVGTFINIAAPTINAEQKP